MTYLRLVLHVVENRQKECCLLGGGSRTSIGSTSGGGCGIFLRRHLGGFVSDEKWVDGMMNGC